MSKRYTLLKKDGKIINISSMSRTEQDSEEESSIVGAYATKKISDEKTSQTH